MREMKDSGVEWIGEIPIKWQTRKLFGLLGKMGSGTTPKGDQYYEDGSIPWLNTGDLNDGYIETTGKAVSELAVKDYPALQLHRAGAVVIAMYGATIGKLGITRIDLTTNQACCAMYPSMSLESKYLFYVLLSAKDYFLFSSYGAGQPNISQNTIRNLRIPFPYKGQQLEIVRYLDDKCMKIGALVERQQAVIEKLKEYKLSLITESVTRGLNYECQMKDSGIDYIGLIPAHWYQCRLRNIGGAQNGISKGAEYFGEGFPFVSYGDVYRNYSLPYEVQGCVRTTAEEQEHYSVEAGDIFFTRTSETIDEVGFSCVCEKTIPRATYAGFVIRVRPYSNVLYTGYAKYYFRSSHHRSYLAKEMNLVTRASLGQDLLKSMPVLVPPKEEQKVIASFLDEKCDEIDYIISQKESLISKLINYKKSMVYEAVTGKREVL